MPDVKKASKHETFVELPSGGYEQIRKEVRDVFLPVDNETSLMFCSSIRNEDERLLVAEPLCESVYDRSFALLVETPKQVRFTKVYYDLGSLASVKWRLDLSGLTFRTTDADGRPKPYSITGYEVDSVYGDMQSIRCRRNRLRREHLPNELTGIEGLASRFDDPAAHRAVHGILEQNKKIKDVLFALELMLWAQPDNVTEGEK